MLHLMLWFALLFVLDYIDHPTYCTNACEYTVIIETTPKECIYINLGFTVKAAVIEN